MSTDAGRAAVEKVAARYGNPEVQTRDAYAQSSVGGIDMMLTLVHGLLRAVGQTRSQLRAMLRFTGRRTPDG